MWLGGEVKSGKRSSSHVVRLRRCVDTLDFVKEMVVGGWGAWNLLDRAQILIMKALQVAKASIAWLRGRRGRTALSQTGWLERLD